MSDIFPRTLFVKGSCIYEFEEEPWTEIDRDPRGIVLMWEPPDRKSKYIMGVDSSEGITGWSRSARTPDDKKTDNGAIEIFKVDGQYELVFKEENGQRVPEIDPQTQRQRRLYKDVQVCEFAAPCDAVEIARVADVLGRIYSGEDEDQCELILESWPGCGMLAMQELLRLGYGHLWNWEYVADGPAEETNRVGWRSTSRSQQLLWSRSRRHLMNMKAIIRSKFLLNEYKSAQFDLEKMRARAASGKHDDRFMAANMAFWAGHSWTYDVERTDEKVTEAPLADFQRFAPTLDDCPSFSDWKVQATADWD